MNENKEFGGCLRQTNIRIHISEFEFERDFRKVMMTTPLPCRYCSNWDCSCGSNDRNF